MSEIYFFVELFLFATALGTAAMLTPTHPRYALALRAGAVAWLGYFLVWHDWNRLGENESIFAILSYLCFAAAVIEGGRASRVDPIREDVGPRYGLPLQGDYPWTRWAIWTVFGFGFLFLAVPDNHDVGLAALVFAAGLFMAGGRFGVGNDEAFRRQRFLEGLILSTAREPNRAELAATIRAIYSHIDEPKFVDGVNVELCRCYELLGVSFVDMMNYQGWRIGPEMLARIDREAERQAAAGRVS